MELINTIITKLKEPLPGEEAQILMAHAYRRKLWPSSPDARNAGVLILFFPQGGDWQIVFIERTSKNPKDVHGGQISFPGGKQEESDESLSACALREAEEEIGIDGSKVNLLGALTPLYIPVSNFLVHPFVGYLEEVPELTPQPQEVQDIVVLPFHHFFDDKYKKHMDMLFGSGMKMDDVPYFDGQGKVIWGATAMILSELLVILDKSHKPVKENL